jgi:hypothetical protein
VSTLTLHAEGIQLKHRYAFEHQVIELTIFRRLMQTIFFRCYGLAIERIATIHFDTFGPCAASLSAIACAWQGTSQGPGSTKIARYSVLHGGHVFFYYGNSHLLFFTHPFC